MNCPLCYESTIQHYHTDSVREYFQCQHCLLVFVPEKFRLSLKDEKAIYDLHINDPADQGYRKFLSRLSTPLLARLPEGAKGLDFGCGPGPTLSLMMKEAGCEMEIYDPAYFNDSSVLQQEYDFICATEVVEHFHKPAEEITRLFGMLKPSGWLGIMTKLVTNRQMFANWHYIRDLTHVCFYSKETFLYISNQYNVQLSFYGSDVILFHAE